MPSGIPDPYTSAVQDFHQMRRQAVLQDLVRTFLSMVHFLHEKRWSYEATGESEPAAGL